LADALSHANRDFWLYAAMDFPHHSQHVLEQLNQQRQLGLLCDCTFVVDGVDFKAHKAVLAACSEYFKMLFVDQKDVVHLDISNAAGTPSGPERACGV
jgi:zinc finger/BTB domain-containing protein 17